MFNLSCQNKIPVSMYGEAIQRDEDIPRGATLVGCRRIPLRPFNAGAYVPLITAGWAGVFRRNPRRRHISAIVPSLFATFRYSSRVKRLSPYEIALLSIGIHDIAPVKVTALQCMDQCFTGCNVGSNWNIVHVAKAQKPCFVRFSWICTNGVTEK